MTRLAEDAVVGEGCHQLTDAEEDGLGANSREQDRVSGKAVALAALG